MATIDFTLEERRRKREQEAKGPVAAARRLLERVRQWRPPPAVTPTPTALPEGTPVPQAQVTPTPTAARPATTIPPYYVAAPGVASQPPPPRFVLQPAPAAVPARRAGEGVASPQGAGLRSLYTGLEAQAPAQPPAQRTSRFLLQYGGTPWEQRAAEAKSQREKVESQRIWQPLIPESVAEKAGQLPVVGRVAGPVVETARSFSSPTALMTLPIGGVSAGAAKALGGAFLGEAVGRAVQPALPERAQPYAPTVGSLAGAVIPGLTEAATRLVIAPQRGAARGLNARPLTEAAPEARPRFLLQRAEEPSPSVGRAPVERPAAAPGARPITEGAEALVLADHLPPAAEVAERSRTLLARISDPKVKRADKVALIREWGEARAQERIHRIVARTDLDPLQQLEELQAYADDLGQRATLEQGVGLEGARIGRTRATPLTTAKIEQVARNAEENAIRDFIEEARIVPQAEAGTGRLPPRTAGAPERPLAEELQGELPAPPPERQRFAQPFGAPLRQPEGLNPPPLELRSPEGKGGLFEQPEAQESMGLTSEQRTTLANLRQAKEQGYLTEQGGRTLRVLEMEEQRQVGLPEAQDWQAAIDAREAADLPPIAGGAMPATYQWRGVAPAVVRPTRGLWAAVTNTVRAARGMPRLTAEDFLHQAEARATVANYGRGIEEASRVSQQAIVDYRKMVPKPPRLKPTGAERAPEGLLGTELDILERPQAYKRGQDLGLAREWWQEYGRMDLADLQQRGIPVNAYEDYVFQHRYGDYFRRLGVTDTSGASVSLRVRMPMQKARQFTTAYDAWKASEGGVAIAADKDGVLHAKFLPKGSPVKVGDTIQVGTRKAFGKEYPIMGKVERIGDPLMPAVTDAASLVASRFEQSALLRAQKDLFDSARDSAVNIARKGVPEGYKTLNNLPGPLADLKLLVPDGAGNTRLVSVRKLAWPTKTADALQGLLAPERLPGAAQNLTNAVAMLRDIRLNLDPSMITLIASRYPLGHPITFLRNAKEFGAVMRSVSAWRQWVAEDPMVRRFIDGGGGGLFQRMEYMPGEAKPLVERFARIPGTPISLQAANEETMRVIGYGTVKTAQVNEQMLRAVRAGMKIAGADKLNIPLTRIARMTDQEILEASVKSAMDQFGKLRYNDLGMSQWSKAVWRNSILTPGFLKTHISLLANSPKAFLGNPEGILGLVFLAQFAGISLGIAEGLSRISGFHTSADPRNVNFGAVRAPFGTFSAMGQVRTYMRLFANLPGDLHAGYYDRLYRSGLSRMGIVPNELATQIGGREYFGEPIADRPGIAGVGQRFLSAGIRSLPIAFQTPVEMAMGKTQAIDPVLASMADWTGASFWPRRTLDLLDDEIRKPPSQGGFGIGWWDAEPWQRQEIEDRHPELQGRAAEEQKMAARRGVQSAQFNERMDEVNALYNGKLQSAVDTLVGEDLRNRYNEIQRERRGAINTVETDPQFAEYIGRREERNAETLAQAQTLRAQGKPLEAKHLLAEYGAIFDRHEQDPTTDALFDDLDAFWAGLKPGEEDQLTRNLGLSLPPEIQAMRKELRTLQPYWQMGDNLWAEMRDNFPELERFPTLDAYTEDVTRRIVQQGLVGRKSPESDWAIRFYNNNLQRTRQYWLLDHSRENAILAKWYGNKAWTPEAQAMVQQQMEQQYGVVAAR